MNTILAKKFDTHMNVTIHLIYQNQVSPRFDDFVNPDEIYEDIIDFDKLKDNMEEILKGFNETRDTVRMDLVLFHDAILHITRIVRVLRQPYGNMLFS
ncbi:unnamed protein product [Rotaria sordida]|uniref:Dynein heavy chain AAA module D4 domain-containing protein n=1 Tax=Rotaria sordida TaxID=392033 RepID=A0A815AXK6_9BILA|nr:unnamed protein product [Rotaria sordida]CAF1542445.1 unnamed protein product [Rotaria sordida]